MKNEFGELIEYLDGKFKEVNSKVDSLNVTVEVLKTSVDGISNDKQSKDQEIAIINHRLENTEQWINKAADKVSIQFKR